ncbi:MAG TPA: DUF2071 domain-containing protein [Flavisolibacter sp.]|jgi:hypothetical protein|nr:DUF2071 domain-containing protein [Flavisolibacter sp.]
MPKVFLEAEWKNLLMANYEVDPHILRRYLPCRTELDTFDGVHYISLVGFLFSNTRVKGISIPFHRTFEEVNLRFYVRFKEQNEWKRGVVFMKEIVPRRMISWVANTLYGENYSTHSMRHRWTTGKEGLEVAYFWKVGREWNYLQALAEADAVRIKTGSMEEFITEHYWGYTHIDSSCTGVYQVEHPKWDIHPVKEFNVNCNSQMLYGPEFADPLGRKPSNVFLASGSAVRVLGGTKIYEQA